MFNNREIATAIWLFLFAIWALSMPSVRKAVGHLIAACLHPKILACIGAMSLYTTAVVLGLRHLGLWQNSLLKDTIIWFVFSGFVLAMEIATSKVHEPIFKKIFYENVKVLIVIEFIMNTYTLPLLAELFLVPFATLLLLVNAQAETETKYASVARATGWLIAFFGFALFGYSLWNAVYDFQSLGNANTVWLILYPPFLSLACVPFIYLLAVWSAYENILVRLKVGPQKNRVVVQYAKRKIIFRFWLKLAKLREFSKRPPFELMQVQTIEDVDRVLETA